MLIEYVRDNIRHIVELHDLTIDDCVSLKIFKTHIEKLESRSLLAQFNRLYGA